MPVIPDNVGPFSFPKRDEDWQVLRNLRLRGDLIVEGNSNLGGGGALTDGDKGDIVISGSGAVFTIDAGVVSNAKLAAIATARFKGRTSGGSGEVEDLTGAQATALLSAVVGDAGAGGTKGLVPAPGAGDAAAGKFLKADGTFALPLAADTDSAPDNADYLVKTLHTGLSAERAVGDTATITADWSGANAVSFNVVKATAAEVRSCASNKVLTADLIESASALVALTDASPIVFDWDAGINRSLTKASNSQLQNPTNGQPGTWRTIIVTQDGTGNRTMSYDTQYQFPGGTEPVLTPTATTGVTVLNIFCVTSSLFYVFSALDMKV